MADYRAISDQIAADIAAGRLERGERLPPQRRFAYERGIAVSTASRVYADLVRRGLVTGEVGRGTYVRPLSARTSPGAAETGTALVNLEHVSSILPDQDAEIAASLGRMLRSEALHAAFARLGTDGTAPARASASRFFSRCGWSAEPAHVLFTGTGRQGIAAALAAIAARGERIGVEELTYPIIRSLAARFGITLVPLAMDAEGVVPEAIVEANGIAPLKGLYLQPALQSPFGATMSPERRAAIAGILNRCDLICIEDAVYSFLCDAEPLAALAPDRVVLIDSLSKRVAPGMSLGFVATPPLLTDRIARSIRNGAYGATGLPLAMAAHLIDDGIAGRIGEAKRVDAATRQAVAREILAGLDLRGDPHAHHLWLALPGPWRAESYAAAAARQGIAVAPASVFAIDPDTAPNGVRLALGSPTLNSLRSALETLRRLVLHGDDRQVE